jgi:hypothetical protein
LPWKEPSEALPMIKDPRAMTNAQCAMSNDERSIEGIGGIE